MQAQARICTKCNDDHSQEVECSSVPLQDGEQFLSELAECLQDYLRAVAFKHTRRRRGGIMERQDVARAFREFQNDIYEHIEEMGDLSAFLQE